MKKLDQDFRSISPVLRQVAKSFPTGSIEEKAIESAAYAYWFLQTHRKLKVVFDTFLSKIRRKLSKSQLRHLRDMGVDTDVPSSVINAQ